jgi:SpoVK/Ycf46/Vps4 family AAA+-type ATPase
LVEEMSEGMMLEEPEYAEECSPPEPDYENKIVARRARIERNVKTNLKLWSSPNGSLFYPVAETRDTLPPDVYEVFVHAQQGPIFQRINYSVEDLLRFEDSVTDEVVDEIQRFWQRRELFEEYELPFRRGILLMGPPGGGKSCTVKLIIHDVIKMGGIAIKFEDVDSFIECMRSFRNIQTDTPVVVIMEDIEAIFQRRRSAILNLLDGIDGFEKIAYLATTNYPEALEPRVKNRPSRFDRRFEIGFPKAAARKQYLDHLLAKSSRVKLDVDKWVTDTNNMSFAHIKELFVSVNLFNREYEDVLRTIRDMSKKVTSEKYGDNGGRVGFMSHANQALM